MLYYAMRKIDEFLYYFGMSDKKVMKVPGRHTYKSARSQKGTVDQAIKRNRGGYRTWIEDDEVYIEKVY